MVIALPVLNCLDKYKPKAFQEDLISSSSKIPDNFAILDELYFETSSNNL